MGLITITCAARRQHLVSQPHTHHSMAMVIHKVLGLITDPAKLESERGAVVGSIF